MTIDAEGALYVADNGRVVGWVGGVPKGSA